MKNKKEDWSGFENLLTKTLNKVIVSDENPRYYVCDDCEYLWFETNFKSAEFKGGYSCPACGKVLKTPCGCLIGHHDSHDVCEK